MKSGTSDDTHVPSARQCPAWTTRPGERAPRARCPRSSLVLGVLVLAAVVSTRWVRLNVSPSVPYGLYRLAAVPTPLTPGTLVVLPVPDSMRAWQTIPLLKPVAAVAGDTVCVEAERLQIAGVDFGPVYRAAQGHTLPTLDGCATVPVGAVFLASHAPRSLDGRYFGVTPLTTVTAQALPVLTWR